MTLVVARVTPLGVRLCGDMRVMDPDTDSPRGYVGAALKMILLRPTLCIAYAGDVGPSLDVIKEVHSSDLSVDDAQARLLQEHLRTNQRAEFLLASLRPSKAHRGERWACRDGHCRLRGRSQRTRDRCTCTSRERAGHARRLWRTNR
jgi:hypothetical protein